MSLVIFMVTVLALPPLVGSLFVCAPKWWKEKVEPKLPRSKRAKKTFNVGPAIKSVLTYDLGGPVIWTRMVALILLPVMLVGTYASWCLALIERKCPYTRGWENESQNEYKDVRSTLGSIWQTLLKG